MKFIAVVNSSWRVALLKQFAYRRSTDQNNRLGAHHPVIIVGAGPVGLTLALDLAQRGQAVVVLDDADRIGEGSRAICFSKRSLEVWDRLGVAQPMVAKGVTWQTGRIFHGDHLLHKFDLLPEAGHKMPAFINLQQYYVEAFLVEKAIQGSEIDLRWRNKVVSIFQHNDHVELMTETPDGPYKLRASYVVACDGARSKLRGMIGADFTGEVFEDQFLIADVKMDAEFPSERWFWFDPPFHSGQSALLHRQPDDIWRIDLQLGPEADPILERRPESVRPRISRMLGHDNFSFEWISVYKFQCRRMQKFVHERIIFAGDSAHQVSPFGARGANSGIEDAENLGWKLAAVLDGRSPNSLLGSYNVERGAAADENIRESTRSTEFMAPTSEYEARMRRALLALAADTDFGKRTVNGGRLSVPSMYESSLSTLDTEPWATGPCPGTHMIDAPLCDGYLSDAFARAGRGFALLQKVDDVPTDVPNGIAHIGIGKGGSLNDDQGLFAKRYDAKEGTAYLLRPDGYVAARFRRPTHDLITAAVDRASGRGL